MKPFRLSLSLSSILVLLSYLICTLLAFLNYPLPYSPVKNWLSDLGNKVLSPNGAIIYNTGIILTAVCLLLFFLGFAALKSSRNRIQNLMIILTQSCGVLGCLSMALSAIYSIDTPGPHSLFSAIMRISIGTAFAFSVAALRYNPKVPRWLLVLGVLTVLTNLLVSVLFNSVQVLEWPTIFLFLAYVLLVGGIMKGSSAMPEGPLRKKSNHLRGAVRWATQMLAALVIFGALLFLAAGRLNWVQGWVYLGMNALTQVLSAAVLIPHHPDMLADRSQVRSGTKAWDRFLAPAILIVGSLTLLITAGLDLRFGWSRPVSVGLWWFAVVIAFASQMFVLWAMASNPFFATTVRIQGDRGHTVIDQGPYRFIRHPGYAGSLVYNLAIPLVLGSWWTFIPALLTIALTFVRTGMEDSTLQTELSGYQEYASAVHYKLVPGVW